MKLPRSIALLALVLTPIACGCGGPPVADLPPPPVSVSQPVVKPVVPYDHYEGRIAAAESVEVRARVYGHLSKISFKEGQIVKKGEPLFDIDDRPYKATLDGAKAQMAAAEANYKLAKAEYERTDQLVVKGAASKRELDVWTAKQAVSVAEKAAAEASIERAELDMEFCKIASPIDGKVSRSLVDAGNLVNTKGADTLLTTIVSVDPIYVYFNVDERSLMRYRQQDRKDKKPATELKDLKIPVYVGLEGEEGYPHKGVIDFADNKINPSTGTIQVRGVLENKDGFLSDGMRARVRVPVGDPTKEILVTERCIGTNQARKFVYVVNEKNVAESRDVVLGRTADDLQIIQQGLKPEDWVIVNGIQRVREGMKVEPKKVPMPYAK